MENLDFICHHIISVRIFLKTVPVTSRSIVALASSVHGVEPITGRSTITVLPYTKDKFTSLSVDDGHCSLHGISWNIGPTM